MDYVGLNYFYRSKKDLLILEYLRDSGCGGQRELLHPEFSKQNRSLRVSQDAATNVICCISDTHSHNVSALVYLLHKVKILRTFENVVPHKTPCVEHF
jgi:hypothetical protein